MDRQESIKVMSQQIVEVTTDLKVATSTIMQIAGVVNTLLQNEQFIEIIATAIVDVKTIIDSKNNKQV